MRPMLPWCEGLFPSSLTLSHLYLTWYTLFPWKRNVPINLAGGQPLWEWELKFHNSLNMLTQRYKSLNNLKIPGMETESGRTVGETCERGLFHSSLLLKHEKQFYRAGYHQLIEPYGTLLPSTIFRRLSKYSFLFLMDKQELGEAKLPKFEGFFPLLTLWSELQTALPFICIHENTYLRMWLYLEIRPLKGWLN